MIDNSNYPVIKLSEPIIIQPEIRCDEFLIVKVEELPGINIQVHYQVNGELRSFIMFDELTFNPDWTDEDIEQGLKNHYGFK
jgi:hypothetical protein